MTRAEIIHKIEQLDEKAEAATEFGNRTKAHHYLDEMAELEGTLSAMGGGE